MVALPKSEKHLLLVRRLETQFGSPVSRHWCQGNPFLTHLLNTYTLLVPGNEGFYIRTLCEVLPRLSDPVLREQVIGFVKQEAQHAIGHRRCWTLLAGQGYRFDRFVQGVEGFVYGPLERVIPLTIRVSMVACVEHVNAFLAYEFLSQRILRDADPDLRALFEWHFAEEIEHKDVSFAVLTHVAPRYLTRIAGVLLTLPLFYLLMTIGALRLMAQDRTLWRPATWRLATRHFWGDHHMVVRTFGHIIRYLRPRFHPLQRDDRDFAEQALRRAAPVLSRVETGKRLEL
jgi:predicted metal-dependent hydrolase